LPRQGGLERCYLCDGSRQEEVGRKVESISDGLRESGMPPSQTGYFPAANEGIDRPVGARAEFLSAAEGQVNQKQPAEVVLDLEVRKPPARPEVEWVLNQSCERAVVPGIMSAFSAAESLSMDRENT